MLCAQCAPKWSPLLSSVAHVQRNARCHHANINADRDPLRPNVKKAVRYDNRAISKALEEPTAPSSPPDMKMLRSGVGWHPIPGRALSGAR